MDGASGHGDWAGMIPRRELPLALNPADRFVASANGRPAAIGYPHYLGWMWDPSYRTRRIHDMLAPASGLTVDAMGVIQNDVHDKAAERFVPVLLAALERARPEDELAKRAEAALRGWSFEAAGSSIAPVVWLEWFGRYREAVWADEWRSRGIEPEGGSWGFTSDNRRESALEVLEYITREHPGSGWFDDRGTQALETRDEVMVRAFAVAVESLRRKFGDDAARWAWTHINRLKIPSLGGDVTLGRSGTHAPGTAFTVNPGGDGGSFDSGAPWRMIVDLGDTSRSVGVYPGGQSEDPVSPHYDDQIEIWAAGKYLPLNAVNEPARLPSDGKARTIRFVP